MAVPQLPYYDGCPKWVQCPGRGNILTRQKGSNNGKHDMYGAHGFLAALEAVKQAVSAKYGGAPVGVFAVGTGHWCAGCAGASGQGAEAPPGCFLYAPSRPVLLTTAGAATT